MNKEIFKNNDSLLNAISTFFDDTMDTTRVINERILWRNLLYYCGEQYLEFMRSSGSFRRRNISPNTPTPVSNEIREYVRSIKAMLMNQKMIPRVWPNTNEKEDELASDTGQNVLIWMDQDHDGAFFDEKEKLIIWLCLSGTAFMRTFPDLDGGRWVQGDDGLWKTGDVATECTVPFNVRLDTFGEKLTQKRWIGIQSLKPREWVEDTFKVKIERAEKGSPVMDYQRKLASLVSDVSPWKGIPFSSASIMTDDDDSVLFREIEFKPQMDYPEGRYVISSTDKILKVYERLPVKSAPDQWNYSLTDFHFNYVPGRFWSDPPVSDLISPQNIINEIDQALAINRKGLGRPRILTAGDIGLKKMDMSGQGFLAMTFNPIMGNKPEINAGTPLPQQVLEERNIQKIQMQDTGGDPKNVLRGKQPSANASGILTQELRETAQQGKEPDVDRFNRSLTRVYKKRIILAQEIYTEERIGKIVGRGNQVKIFKFKSSDLRGNTDVRLELDSGLIATKSGQAQMMLNMVQAGFFQGGENAVAPDIKQEILQRMGMSTFTEQTNNDVERAELENAEVASGKGEVMTAIMNPQTGEMEVVTDDPLFKYDNHAAHYETHRKFIISPEFKEVPVQLQSVIVMHADLHKKQIEDVQPDIRDYVQIDKLLVADVLTQSERAQVLEKYFGIKPGNEPMSGLPKADTVTKAKQKMMDVDKKLVKDREQMAMDMQKHIISEGIKAKAINKSPNE
jgi:hypothetical protein